MGTDKARDTLADTLAAPLLALGLDLETVDLTPAGRRRQLRVVVDKDGGVTLDDIAEATKEVSRVLDTSDVTADALGEQPYTLEVTSPGVDRPLTLARHWRRNAGRLVKVSLRDGATVTGRVTDSGEEAAVLDVDGRTQEIAYAEVAKARVQVEFKKSGG